MPLGVSLLVLAKAPVPGRCKTRLCPPLTFAQAAVVAEAAIGDTLAAVSGARVQRRILVFDGSPDSWLPSGFELIRQRDGGLDERIADAFTRAGGPSILVGMDTPQVTPLLLERAAALLLTPGVDAVLGMALDGGWWSIGLRDPNPDLFLGVPMSTSFTGHAQRARLGQYRLRVAELPVLRDVDSIADAMAVAAVIPHSRFAEVVRAVHP